MRCSRWLKSAMLLYRLGACAPAERGSNWHACLLCVFDGAGDRLEAEVVAVDHGLRLEQGVVDVVSHDALRGRSQGAGVAGRVQADDEDAESACVRLRGQAVLVRRLAA